MDKLMKVLQSEMPRPTMYGPFHIMWIIISIILVIYFIKDKNYSEKKLKTILLVYGVIAFILELLKQISWSYDAGIWSYTWYAAPFQLCTTPIYVSLICLFLKKGKLRDSLLSYLSFITILGSITTAIYPATCFVRDILVNIHTMYLHFGSLVVSLYLLISGEVKINKENFFNAYKVFLVFVLFAEILNIIVYKSGILNGQTFNMFYISPYFPSTLPVFDIIYEHFPFIVFLLIYLLVIFLGTAFIYLISKVINKKVNRL